VLLMRASDVATIWAQAEGVTTKVGRMVDYTGATSRLHCKERERRSNPSLRNERYGLRFALMTFLLATHDKTARRANHQKSVQPLGKKYSA
jgi:hypothetical protein